MELKQKIHDLVFAKKTDEEIQKIIAEDEKIKLQFETIIKGINVAYEAYGKEDVASLNVCIDNLIASRKNISELEKILEEKKNAATQPGAGSPPAEPAKV